MNDGFILACISQIKFIQKLALAILCASNFISAIAADGGTNLDKDLARGLEGTIWTWEANQRNLGSKLRFLKDGIAIINNDPPTHWAVEDADSVTLAIGAQLKFSPDRTRYEGKNVQGAVRLGSRIWPVVNPPLAGIPAPQQPTQERADIPTVAGNPLDTLAQQAPNAIEWVLAPLDAGVPPNIRQNVAYLREALLDDAAKKRKASPDAYKAGEQLCNSMIAVLDERNGALARAGFRTVEAQARTGVKNEALDARRNYTMTWPQFAREVTQRSELKSQAVNSAAVIAERPKLEWSQRTAQIRPTLDTLYKQFREALRKSG